MIITLNIWVLLFGCGLVVGLFLQLLFLFFRKKHSPHFNNIIAALFVMSLILLDEILQESNIVDQYPFLIDITITADLLIWPFFLFYVQAITNKRNSYQRTDLIYFLPFLIGFLWQVPYTFLSGAEKLNYFGQGIPSSIAFFVFYKMSVAFLFLGYTLSILTTQLKRVRELFQGNKKAFLFSDIKKLTIIVTVVILFVYFSFFNNYFGLFPLGESDKIGSLLIISTFYFIGILAFKNPEIFDEKPYSSSIVNYFKGAEPAYTDRLFELFERDKLYLNEKMGIKDVAMELNLTSQQLSYLINQHLGITFLDFVNTYRVKAVKKAIERGEHRKKTLLGLALESGFSNKATFNRIFKNHEGVSPSLYAEKILKEVSNSN